MSELMKQKVVVTECATTKFITVSIDRLVLHAEVRGFGHAELFLPPRIRAKPFFHMLQNFRKLVFKERTGVFFMVFNRPKLCGDLGSVD